MFDEYDLIIYVKPCIVDSYVDTVTVGVIYYNIGAPTITDGPYEFKQSPMCGYPETLTVTNLPGFARHRG